MKAPPAWAGRAVKPRSRKAAREAQGLTARTRPKPSFAGNRNCDSRGLEGEVEALECFDRDPITYVHLASPSREVQMKSTAPRWCIFSDRPAPAKATLPRPWPSRP